MPNTTMIDPTEAKAQEVNRIAAQIDDRRLDATAAVSLAIDAMERYDVITHGSMSPREFLKAVAPERFMWIRNAGVAVKAVELLINERS